MENLTSKQNLEGVLNVVKQNINNSFSTIYSKEDVMNMLIFIASNTKESSNGIGEWFENGGIDKIKVLVREMMSDAISSTTFSSHCQMDGYLNNSDEYRVTIEVDEDGIEEEIIGNLDMDEFEENLTNLIDVELVQELVQSNS